MANKKNKKTRIQFPDGGLLPKGSLILDRQMLQYNKAKNYSQPQYLENSNDDFYTYEKRPEAKYKKDGDSWYINLGESTQNKYKLIEDKDGSRSKELNRVAKLNSLQSNKISPNSTPLMETIRGKSSSDNDLPFPLMSPTSEAVTSYQDNIKNFNKWLGDKGYHTPTRKVGEANTEGGLNCINGVCYVLEQSGAKKFNQPYTGNLTFTDNLEKEGYYSVNPKDSNFQGFEVGDVVQYAREKGKNSKLFPNISEENKKDLYPFHAKLILDSYEKNGKKYYVVGHNGGGTEFITSHELAEDLHKDATNPNSQKKSDGILVNRYNPDKVLYDKKTQQFKQEKLAQQYSNFKPDIGVHSSEFSNSVLTKLKQITDNEFNEIGKHAELDPKTLQELIRLQIGIASQETKFGEDQNPELTAFSLAVARGAKSIVRTSDDWRQDYWKKNVDNIQDKYNSLDDFKKANSLKGKVQTSDKQSLGVFQQKEISDTGKKAGIKDLKTLENQIKASIYNSVDNYKTISKKYPDLDEQSKLKLTVLMHNAPSKALNPTYVNHYLKNNDIDYVNKVQTQTQKYQFEDGGDLNNIPFMKKKCTDCNNKKKLKLPPLELNPYVARQGAKIMQDGGTYYAPGAMNYNTNFVDQNEVMRDATEGTQTMEAVGDTVKQGVSTAIPIAGLFAGAESMGTGIAESTGKTETQKNYNKRVSEGLFDPFTSQVNMWADDDISTADKIGATLLGGWGASGHHLAKAENKRYSDEVMKQMFTEDRNEFAEAPKTMYQDGGNFNSPTGMPTGENLEYNEFEGLPHSQGGIPLGPDAEVEGGEVRVEDYIFSDNLKNPLTKKTFAEEAKRIKKKYEGRLNDAPSNRAMAKELERLMVANDMAREVKQAEEEAAMQEADAMMAQDLAATGSLDEVGEAAMNMGGDMGGDYMDAPLEETPVEQFKDGGYIAPDDPIKEFLKNNSADVLATSRKYGAVGKQFEKGSDRYNELLDSQFNSLGLKKDDYEYDFEFYDSTAVPGGYHSLVSYLRPKKKDVEAKPRPEEHYFLREPNSTVLNKTDRLGYQKANPASKVPAVRGDIYQGLSGLEGINAYKDASGKTIWLDKEAKGLYELGEDGTRIPYSTTPVNTDTTSESAEPTEFEDGGIFRSKSKKDADKIARKNRPADTLSSKYGDKNWFESEEGAGSAYSLPLIPALKKSREVNKMIKDEGLDYAKIKALSYYNRPQEVAKFKDGGRIKYSNGGYDPNLVASFLDNIQFSPMDIGIAPQASPMPSDAVYADSINPTIPTRGLGEINQGELAIPSDADFANTRKSVLGDDPIGNQDPAGSKSKQSMFNSDMAALGFSNLAALDNLVNSRNIEKTKMPEVALDRVSYEDARQAMSRDLSTQQMVGQRNIGRQSTTAGQQLSNQAAQSASIADAKVRGFMQSFGAENAANAQISNQEKMYNVNALKESVIANEQNRAAGRNARQAAFADIGQNTQGYMRDQKAEQRQNEYNELQFKLIDQYYPNYSLMTPEQRAQADFNVQQWIQNPNMHYRS